MGNNVSNGGLTVNAKARNGNRKWFKVDPLIISKEDVEDILEDVAQKPGTYVVYEDPEREKTYLAVKMATGHTAHHVIKKLNDLYYFNDFPFPYLESIILYYQRHKFRGTKFTQQAFVSPYVTAQRCRMNATSRPAFKVEPQGKRSYQDAAGTWSYGQYKPFRQQMLMAQRQEEDEEGRFEAQLAQKYGQAGVTRM